MNIKEGDICTVNMNVIRNHAQRDGFAGSHWMKVVRDTVKMGGGEVRVSEVISNYDVMVVAVGAGAIMGAAKVPVEALKVVGKQAMNKNLVAKELLSVAKELVSQNLENVKTLEKLTDRELTRAIRDAIIAEEGAINQYETIADSTDNKQVKEVLQSLSDEERVHVGELQELLNGLLDDEVDLLEEGAGEVEDMKDGKDE